jgi:hypothetical protein
VNNVQLPARFANRQNKRSLVAAVSAGLGMASPPYVSIKGGSFTLVDANGEQEPVETRHLDCVIFDVNLDVPVQRVFWGADRAYNPNSNVAYEPPECFSDNGIGASSQAAKPQSPLCQTCEQNTWGSAISKVTGKPVKACHVIKKVAVLPIVGAVGPDSTYNPTVSYDFPFLLRIPVMSHENLRAYSTKFAGQDFDVSDVVTRISFVHGQVGQIDFQAAGFTAQATEDAIQKFLAAHVTDALIGRGDLPWKGEARQIAAPAAQAAQMPFPTQMPFSTQEPTAQAQPANVAPFPQAQPEPTRRGRKLKEQASPLDTSIPPFLQRAAPQAATPAHGIQAAPPPNAEMEAALANVFGLKT